MVTKKGRDWRDLLIFHLSTYILQALGGDWVQSSSCGCLWRTGPHQKPAWNLSLSELGMHPALLLQQSWDSCLPPKVIFHQSSSSTGGCLPLKDVFHRRSSSPKGCLLLRIVFHQRLSSTEGRLPPKAVFYQRSSSTEDWYPPKVVFHRRTSYTNHNTLVDLIFVRTVNAIDWGSMLPKCTPVENMILCRLRCYFYGTITFG